MEQNQKIKPEVLALRCYDIQTSLGRQDVPEFDELGLIGMAVRLSLHIRGLPLIGYETLKLVANHFLGISSIALKRVVELLEEIGFLYINSEGRTYKSVLPIVPYYDELYEGFGDYVSSNEPFTEPEQLALEIVDRLAASPENTDRLRNLLNIEEKHYKRNLQIGTEGGYLSIRRVRGRTIIVNPSYFAENAELFADHVASSDSQQVSTLLKTLKFYQGWPLAVIQKSSKLGSMSLLPSQIRLLERLAQEGATNMPTITTPHAGLNSFMFTPTPFQKNLNPFKRDVYEKAMAIVAAVRQGQLLPDRYAIRFPAAVIRTLIENKKFSRATSEFKHQYSNLVHLRVGQLIDVGNSMFEFHIIDKPENMEALKIAHQLISEGEAPSFEVDDDARAALQMDYQYVESLTAAAELRRSKLIGVEPDALFEIETLLLKGSNL